MAEHFAHQHTSNSRSLDIPPSSPSRHIACSSSSPTSPKESSIREWLVSQQSDQPSKDPALLFPFPKSNLLAPPRSHSSPSRHYTPAIVPPALLPVPVPTELAVDSSVSEAGSSLGRDGRPVALDSGVTKSNASDTLLKRTLDPYETAERRRVIAADAQSRRRKLTVTIVVVIVLVLSATALAVYFSLARRGGSGGSKGSTSNTGDGNDDIIDHNLFPNLSPLAPSGSIPITSLRRPTSPAASRIVFNPNDRSNIGQYRLAKGDGGNSGVVAIHIGLMKGTSKVAMLQRWDYLGTNATIPGTDIPAWSSEYDYTTDTFRPLKLKSNVFCGGGMLLPDGRLTVLGGAENFTELGGLLDGMKSIRLLSPSGSAGKFGNADWVDDPSNSKISLASKRWYPSVVTLPEGRLLIIGGTTVAVAFTSPPNNTGTMEIIPPVRNYARPDDALIPLQFLWDTLPANLYPTSTVLPSGRIFITASDRATLLDPSQGYGALRTFLLRPSAASSASSSTTGICLQPPPNGESTLTGPTDFLTTRSCVGPSSFNQNRTADHPQTFSFYGAPIPSSTNTERYSNPLGFAQRDAYPGAGWVVHTESKMCLAVLGGAVGGRVGFKRCVAEDVEQLFDVGEGVVRHVGSGGCLGVTGTSVSVTACSNDASSSTRIDVVDTSVYFEFPRLPGGPFRSYPWTGTGLMLPLDPYDNYDPAVMVCGGSVHPQGLQAVESNTSIGLSTCGTIRPERPDANWTVEVMPSPRVLGDLIHLPDGTLLLLNGAQRGMAGWDLGRNPNLAAHLYNPLAPLGSRWSVLDSSTIPRMYHSSAMLLPDGRVMVAGSSPNSPTDRSWSRMYENEYRVEYFHPPYLLDRNASRPRPMIAEASWPSATVSWSYNTTYSLRVGVADPAATSTKGVRMLTTDEMGRRNVRFNIVQTGFRTHSTSFGQRLVWLVSQVGRSEGEVVLGAPPNAAVAPPGWYLLFAVMDGVPSEGKWVQVGGDPAELGKYYDV